MYRLQLAMFFRRCSQITRKLDITGQKHASRRAKARLFLTSEQPRGWQKFAHLGSLMLVALYLIFTPLFSTLVHASNDYPWAGAAPVPSTGDWGYTTCPNTDPGCMRTAAETGTDNKIYGVIDPYGYYFRNCTSWVAWRLDQHGISMGGSWGNAWQWKDAAASKGYLFNTTASAGAIAYWSNTNAFHKSNGHVGYVEATPTSTTATISQYNAASDGNYSSPTIDSTKADSLSNDIPDGYIHIELGSSFAPTGKWQAPTAADLSYFSPGNVISLYAQGTDTQGSGLNRINVTSYTPGSSWGIIKATPFPAGTTTGSASAATIMPDADYILVSFDAYSNNGTYRLAPDGVRKYCNALRVTSCTHVAGEGGQSLPGQGGSVVCTTPPTTSSSVTGSTLGNHGWWRSPTTVTLSANAPCGGSGPQTYYAINGGTKNTYSGPIALNQEGIDTINYYSVDALGNTESSKSITVSMDWTPPVTMGTATGPRDTNGIFRDNVIIGLNATDNLSGVDYEQYSRDGGTTWTNLSGANNNFILSGNGVSRVQYRSVDIAGNVEQPHDSGPIIINKYVVFSNGTGSSLQFLYGTGVNVTGDIFSNGSTYIDGNTGSSLGTTFTTAGSANTIGSGNTNTTIPAITTGAALVPMLNYPLSLYQSLATVVFPSDLIMDSVSSSLNSIIYAQGNVTMYDVALSGPLSLVATGSITDNTTDSTYQTNDPHNGVLLYAGKDITVNSTGNRNLGLMYAPNGTINVAATNLTLNGSLVANQVNVKAATTFNLSYSPAFSSSTYSLPLTAMGLVVPTTTPPPLPSMPTLYGPSNGATVSSTGVGFVWGNSTGAVGYQLQVSASSSFGTLTYNASQFSHARKMNLSPATTYYWRVRAINQAGMTNWSNGTFKTQ